MSREKCLQIILRRYPELGSAVQFSHIDWLQLTAKYILNNPNK